MLWTPVRVVTLVLLVFYEFCTPNIIQSTYSQLALHSHQSQQDHLSAVFMTIIWPFDFSNAHQVSLSLGFLNVAELLSLMVTINSSQTL